MSILVTGGLGFIGSHICVELLEKNYNVVVIDNLSNAKMNVIDSIEKITNKKITAYIFDMRDKKELDTLFKKHTIKTVIHCAGLKAVGQSVKLPLLYYSQNLTILFNLLETMELHKCHNLIFSSSATVYNSSVNKLFKEDDEIGSNISNPYGWTKYMQEQILKDLVYADKKWNITVLRYFNPIGAHQSHLIGESPPFMSGPNNAPNNLMPHIIKAVKENTCLNIFGSDYDTKDKTCVRDFVHVVDVAKGHIAVLEHIDKENTNKTRFNAYSVYNLGTGVGVSVLELIKTFEKVNNVKINYKFVERRAGDVPETCANVEKAKKDLNWSTTKTLEDMCRDSYLFK